MQGGDISNLSTPRTWVLEDVVLSREPMMAVDPPKRSWWRRKAPVSPQEAVVVQQGPVSLLWRYSQRWSESGMKIELVHIGTDERAAEILDLLDRSSASPFSDVIVFVSLEELVDHLPYRPDVMHLVDVDDRFMRWGSRGITLRDLG